MGNIAVVLRNLLPFLAGAVIFLTPLTGEADQGPERILFGIASYYSERFHGRPTASGELYDSKGLTAAHPTLPFGTLVRVHNLKNGRSLVVRINDRGPFHRGRIIDVSGTAARSLGFFRAGKAKVRLEVVELPDSVAGR